MGRKSNFDKLKEIYGIFSGERGENLEKSIEDGRKQHQEMHKKRIARLK
ncbi:MAG: hypothetical protein Q7S27_04435 [Nanoarchaeota archaeon]|nr:hypothetical protein [Nanoarchaeota archaeon]